jgi:hypothetical protein
MIWIRVVGRIMYRCMVITFLYLIAANLLKSMWPKHSLDSLLLGLAIGILASFLSEVYKPRFD